MGEGRDGKRERGGVEDKGERRREDGGKERKRLTNEMYLWMYHRSGNFCVAFFRVKDVCMFNFCYVAKWRKLNARVRNFHAFNFCRLSNW